MGGPGCVTFCDTGDPKTARMHSRKIPAPAALAALAMAGIWIALAAPRAVASGGLHEVVASGHGVTDEAALRSAFVSALERTVGAIVHSSTVSRNFRIESDVQLLLTNGCIESYEEISSSRSQGVVSKTIRARVRRGVVADWMRDSGWSGQADLNDTWARLATSIRSRQQALRMLHEKVPAIRDSLYRAVPVDISTGLDAGGGTVPPPFTEENLDGDVLCVWAAALRPDYEFWENHAVPLLAACFEALSEKKARLFLNMESAPAGIPPHGAFARIPNRRWQRFEPGATPPWVGADAPPVPAHAPHCIALETRTTHAESLDLTLYFFTPEIYGRIFNPPEIRNAEGNLVSRPERFGNLRFGVRGRLHFSDGTEKSFSAVQPSPLFRTLPLPWPGGLQIAYCGPFLFPSLHTGGWEKKSAWPVWQGPVAPLSATPGLGPFLIEGGRIQRSDGEAQHRVREYIDSRRPHYRSMPPPWETDDEAIVPLVFNLKLDELRRIRRMDVEPVTGAPPPAPGVGDSLKKLLKRLLD